MEHSNSLPQDVDIESQPKTVVHTSLNLIHSMKVDSQSLDEYKPPDSLLSFIGHEEERSINFATELFPSNHGESLHIVDDVAFSLIEFLKIKFANRENDVNSLLKNEWLEELKKNNEFHLSQANRAEYTQYNDIDDENIDISQERDTEYRWELEELKNKSLKVDNFMIDEDAEENIYIPSFVHRSPKPQVLIEEPLQVDDLEDEDATKVHPVEIIQEHDAPNVEVIETLEFEDEEDDEDANNEESPESISMVSFLLQLNRLPGNHSTQGLLEQYLANKQNQELNHVHSTISEGFNPDRHFTDVEEFEEVVL